MTMAAMPKRAGRSDRIERMPDTELPPHATAVFTAPLDPDTDKARGKPGEFVPYEAAIILTNDPDCPVHFAVFSRKRQVDNPPVYLELTRKSARLLRGLFRKVDGGASKREYAIEQALEKLEQEQPDVRAAIKLLREAE